MDDSDDQTNQPIEGEIVEDMTPHNSTDGGIEEANAGQVLVNMESLIKQHQQQIDKLTEEAGKYNDMINDVLANDETYKKYEEEAKQANKVKSTYKQQILRLPQNATLVEKLKSARSSLKDLKDALSDYLGEYARMSGSNTVEGYDGELREIVYVAKLVRKSSKNP